MAVNKKFWQGSLVAIGILIFSLACGILINATVNKDDVATVMGDATTVELVNPVTCYPINGESDLPDQLDNLRKMGHDPQYSSGIWWVDGVEASNIPDSHEDSPTFLCIKGRG